MYMLARPGVWPQMSQSELKVCNPSQGTGSWGVQAGTSHNLGTNFATAFGTRFENEKGELMAVHQTSWGMSTRMVGGVIMSHGDDAGLRLPPALAPIQATPEPLAFFGPRRSLPPRAPPPPRPVHTHARTLRWRQADVDTRL